MFYVFGSAGMQLCHTGHCCKKTGAQGLLSRPERLEVVRRQGTPFALSSLSKSTKQRSVSRWKLRLWSLVFAFYGADSPKAHRRWAADFHSFGCAAGCGELVQLRCYEVFRIITGEEDSMTRGCCRALGSGYISDAECRSVETLKRHAASKV